ncbi:MAG: hypothetical protein ACFB2Z_04125 [Maricaulaceae bacterium]
MLTAQALEDAETALFREWREVCPNLVADGAVNPTAYCERQIRVLFVLKEVHDPGGGGWDLREFLREGGRRQTWNNVTRWLTAINNLPADTDCSEMATVTEADRKVSLDGIAAMNLKKEPGGHTAVSEQVYSAAKNHTTLLKRQFELYSPHLTICCGVGDLAYTAMFGNDGPVWRETSRGIRYCEISSNRFMIAYSHPEARVHAPILIYGLVDAVKEIRALRSTSQ